MKAHGNGNPQTCASNLLRIVRGEVPYDRVRGIDGSLIDQPNATRKMEADSKWVLENYEPRVDIDSVETIAENAHNGNYSTIAKIKRKEDEE